MEQFKDLLVIILIIAAIISAISGNGESTIVIVAVITLNAILGTVQHFKAEKSLESLKALSSPSAKVMRDGRKIEVPSKEIVPGDILMLEAGDLVVADGRIIENYSLQVNESSLTGESEGVDKISDVIDAENVALGDQKNMVFSGSLVTYGRASVVVTATGMKTEIGKIATLMNQTQQKKTPLQESMDNFQPEAGNRNYRYLYRCIRPEPVPSDANSGFSDVRCCFGSCSNSRSAQFDCYHRSGNGYPEDGKRKRNYQGTQRSRKLGFCIGYLFG